MVLKHQEPNPVRRYLLQQLSDSEQQALELRLLDDEELSEELEIVEDELIDEYLANKLSQEERVRFEAIFLAHPSRQRKLEAGEALQRYLTNNPHKPGVRPGILERLVQWARSYFSRTPNYVTDVEYQPSGIAVLRPSLVMAIGLVLVAIVGFTIWRLAIYQSDLQNGLLALNQAYRINRPLEARVSGINYAPFDTLRSGKPESVNDVERKRAESLIFEALEERKDAASYHALGQLFLLQKDLDKAIAFLEEARKADDNNPQIYSDLGAAYLEKGQLELDKSQAEPPGADSGKNIESFGRSLDYLKRALELNQGLLEALFNRALVHRYQGLYREAEADWRAYLEKDPDSKWAEEARQNLKLLEERNNRKAADAGDPFDTFIQAYRARDDELAWGIYKRNHRARGNEVTKQILDHLLADANWKTSESFQALNYLGELEVRKAKDAYTADLAKFYASLTPQTQPLLAQARKDFAEGYKLLGEAKISNANKLLEGALGTFQKTANLPEALKAEAAIAHGAVVEPNNDKATELLARVISGCESRQYQWLLAQILSDRAHLQTNLNNYSEAFNDGAQSLQIFQAVGDTSNVLDGFVQIAGLHLFLNDNEMSFSYLGRALALAENERALERIWRIQITISLNLTALKLYRSALDYQKESLLLARSLNPLYVSRSYQYIGLTYGSLGQLDLGLENLQLAYEQGTSRAGENIGQNMMASASLKRGDLYRAFGDADSALASYDESFRRYEALGSEHYSYAAHKGRFLAYLAQNNNAMASQELEIVLTLFNTYRQKILEERQNSFFFDKEQDTYDLAIDFAYSRLGNERQAYDYSEICRARNLNDLMRHGAEVAQTASGLDLRLSGASKSESALPLTATEILDRLPEDIQIVQFSVLEKKGLVWYLSKWKQLVAKPLDVESAKLSELVMTTLKQIERHDLNGSEANLKTLYNLLIKPISDELDPDLVLCFIPDKDLHFVPFNALISDSSGRYLAQDYRILISHSATVLIESSAKARARSSAKAETLLAVGNPAFDRMANPNLARLPGAEREVEGIKARYLNPRILVRGQATRESVTRDLPRADVTHFAAHYEIDPRSQLSSKLLLAARPGERAHNQASGLSSGDIYRMNLARTKLVILSGCKTGIERQFRGEGATGFARAFLVAGVPVVVASLWPVDSDATAELMIAFHRFRKLKNMSTTEALMRAQRHMMDHENSRYHDPYYWAGFTVTGGYSDY